MSDVEWSAVALRDLRRLYFFLLPKDPDAASRALVDIRRAADRLIDFPLSGPPYGTSIYRKLNVATDYAILYRVRHRQVRISRVYHLAENWKRA